MVLLWYNPYMENFSKNAVARAFGETAPEDRKILFLDFDGVLNNDDTHKRVRTPVWVGNGKWLFNWIDPCLVSRLRPLLADPNFRIVVSSAWRHSWTKAELTKILNGAAPGVGDRVIDITPKSIGNSEFFWDRGREIDAWIKASGYRGKFAILDDDRSMLPYQEKRFFVNTNPKYGVTYYDVAKIKRLLGYNVQPLKLAA